MRMPISQATLVYERLWMRLATPARASVDVVVGLQVISGVCGREFWGLFLLSGSALVGNALCAYDGGFGIHEHAVSYWSCGANSFTFARRSCRSRGSHLRGGSHACCSGHGQSAAARVVRRF